jgi:hypothetical protein
MHRILLLVCCLGVTLQAAESGIEQRRRIRQELKNPAAAEKELSNPDPAIRLYALYQYTRLNGEAALPKLSGLAADKDASVINFLTMFAASARDQEAGKRLLREIAAKNPDPQLRGLASRYVSTFNFHRETKRLKFDPQWDHEILTVKSIMLPGNGWKFAVDPMTNGHEKNFFAINFDDSSWKELKIGGWNAQGIRDYSGVAWYRLTFKMPEKIDSNAVELYFRGVDECAWVWLNGVYCGQHDEGPAGWNRPFWLDVTKEIRWNAENTLVVRVYNSVQDGGIWKPVSLEILK